MSVIHPSHGAGRDPVAIGANTKHHIFSQGHIEDQPLCGAVLRDEHTGMIYLDVAGGGGPHPGDGSHEFTLSVAFYRRDPHDLAGPDGQGARNEPTPVTRSRWK